MLFGRGESGYQKDIANTLMLSLFMVAAFTAFFCSEFSTGMIIMIGSYKYGRKKTFKTKIRLCAVSATLSFLGIYVFQIISILKKYGLNSWTADISSIPAIADFPVNLPIWLYVVVLYTVRLLSAFMLLGLLLLICAAAKNTTRAIIILSGVLLMPPALYLIGLDKINYFSLNGFLSGNMILNLGCENHLMLSLVFLPVILIFIFRVLFNRMFICTN